MSVDNYDFKQTHFPHVTLQKVIGQPNYEHLTKIYKQVKANSLSVPSSAGGGQHGHLGAVVSAAKYAFVSNEPFDPPVDPGPLVFPANTTQQQARLIDHERRERLTKFKTYNAVLRQIKQQIEEAIDDDWLDALRNPVSNTITYSIPEIFEHLFRLYGDVNSDKLEERHDAVKNMTWDPATQGMDHVYNAVSKLMDFADAANAPYSQAQIINIAYKLVKSTGRFSQAITEWNRLVDANANHRTWMNFKDHFRRAYKEVKESSSLVAQQTPFQAAQVVQEITDALSERISDTVQEQMNLLVPPQEHIAPFVPPPVYYQPHFPPTQPPATPTFSQESANVVTQNDIATIMNSVMQMQQQTLQQMQGMLTNHINQGGRSNRNNRGNNRGGRGGRGNRNNRNQQGNQQGNQQSYQQGNQQGTQNGNQNRGVTPGYCWTHGYLGHTGDQCRSPAPGHIASATLTNRMGGSTNNLPPGL